jgi:hypothetical protein
MVYSTVDVVGASSVTAGTSATINAGTAATGDAVFLHIVWTNPAVSSVVDNDWVVVPGTNVVGPDYASAVYSHVLDGTDSINLSWTGSSHWTWQLIACDGLTATPLDLSETAQSNSAATLPRLNGVGATDHVLCFAGSVNGLSQTNVRAYPDVGFVVAEETQSAAGRPTLWVGQFSGPIGDLAVTLPASVYFDPPPTHSVGHTLSVLVA